MVGCDGLLCAEVSPSTLTETDASLGDIPQIQAAAFVLGAEETGKGIIVLSNDNAEEVTKEEDCIL